MTPQQEERRGENARIVLESDVYKEAYAQIESNIINRLASQATNAEEAEDLRRLLIALRKVKIYMEQVLLTGTMAATEQARQQSVSDRLRRLYNGSF